MDEFDDDFEAALEAELGGLEDDMDDMDLDDIDAELEALAGGDDDDFDFDEVDELTASHLKSQSVGASAVDTTALNENWDDEEEEEEVKPKKVAPKKKPQPKQPQQKALSKKEKKAAAKVARTTALARAQASQQKTRAPICCVLGHVDSGKTKILDYLRRTNVQDRETGGITQQIGATFVPVEAIRKETRELNEMLGGRLNFELPGLLVIDTPGHASFSNLRSRGSSLANIAILVINIMEGIQPQTIESIQLMRENRVPFVVALNQVDRLYEWRATEKAPIQKALKKQTKRVRAIFEDRVNAVIAELACQHINAALYWKNKDMKGTVSLVPTSAHTGEGLQDLMAMIMQLTQKFMSSKMTFVADSVECTVLEVKPTPGVGTTIDCVLSNGQMYVGDTIVLPGLQGPIRTTIKALLTPPPMREIRVKSDYQRNKFVTASLGVKIAANGLEDAIAGSQVRVVREGDDVNAVMEEVSEELFSVLESHKSKSGKGVYVMASTLGSLEALLGFLAEHDIPVLDVALGDVTKRDVSKASTMLDCGQKEYASILAFNVDAPVEVRSMAASLGVRIFTAEIIYHLEEEFTEYLEQLREERRAAATGDAVFPVIMELMKDHVYHQRDPIICGVSVKAGILKVGTPLCAMFQPESGDHHHVPIGKVISIQENEKDVGYARAGQDVCVKIAPTNDSGPVLYGRHFDHRNRLCSIISRATIEALKANYRDDMEDDDWRLIIRLKPFFDII